MSAKRAVPTDLPPLAAGHLMISAPHFATIDGASVNGGVIEARDSTTKKLVWTLQVYKNKYDPHMEKDVQDVFIKTLSYDPTHDLLIMSNENGEVFVVDPKTRKVTPIVRQGTPQKAGQ